MWTYETALNWTPGGESTEEAAGRPPLTISPPPEFDGRPDRWNPELLLVGAIESCLLLTALSVAQRQKLSLAAYSSRAVGHLEKTPEGLRFSRIEIAVTVQADDMEKARKLVQIAEKYCPVSNAVKCPVHVTVA